MPHLSPMSWISLMFMIWVSVWIMMVSMWWNPVMKFKTMMVNYKKVNFTHWKWY